MFSYRPKEINARIDTTSINRVRNGGDEKNERLIAIEGAKELAFPMVTICRGDSGEDSVPYVILAPPFIDSRKDYNTLEVKERYWRQEWFVVQLKALSRDYSGVCVIGGARERVAQKTDRLWLTASLAS